MTANDDQQAAGQVWRSLAAGGLAGCIAKTIIGPLDRVKILFQTGQPQYKSYAGSITGVFRAAHAIWKQDGIFHGLYRGHTLMMARIFPYAAVQYASYEKAKQWLMPPGHEKTEWRRLAAGSIAGISSVAVTYPLDLLRARYAYYTSSHPLETVPVGARMWALVKDTYRHGGGLAAFYRGFAPTVYGIVPYAGVSFYAYEHLLSIASMIHYQIYPHSQGDPHSTTMRLVCGAMAGAVAQTIAYPLDVLRRRMQLTGAASHLSPKPETTWAVLKRTIRDAPSIRRALFVGLSVNYVKVAPATGVSFAAYALLAKWFGVTQRGDM